MPTNILAAVRGTAMRKIMGVCCVSIVLLSCSAEKKAPLAQGECEAIARKEATHLASRFNEYPDMKAAILRIGSSRATECAGGKVFDREDYDCVMAARDDEEIDTCLKVVAGKDY